MEDDARQPAIGLTTYGREEGSFSLPGDYTDAIRRAGGVPVLLPPVGDEGIGVILSRGVDGLVLTGGGDVDPAHYGGAHHGTVYMVDDERDAFELDLARRAVEAKVPTLCICRGVQILNVALGGTLIEHLPEAVGDRIAHRVPPRRPNWHEVYMEPESALAGVIGATALWAGSWHHQAVGRLAPGLRAVARAADGTIEAVEMAGEPWLLAVQWHPELTAGSDPRQQALFDAVVQAAGADEVMMSAAPAGAARSEGG